MKKNIILNTFNTSDVWNYNKAIIETKKYKLTLKKNSIHSPSVAIIKFYNDDLETILLLKNAIIFVDQFETIKIWTHSSKEFSTLENINEINQEYNEKFLKGQLETINSKKIFGLSSLEKLNNKNIEVKLEILDFIKKIKMTDF